MLRRAGTLGLCLAMAGCSLLGPRTKGPDGLSVYDGDLRRLVRQARFDDALELAGNRLALATGPPAFTPQYENRPIDPAEKEVMP